METFFNNSDHQSIVYSITAEAMVEALRQIKQDAILEAKEQFLKEMDTQMITSKEAMAELGIGENTLSNYVKRGKLHPVRFGNRYKYKLLEIIEVKTGRQ